jgi:hypothetical protein
MHIKLFVACSKSLDAFIWMKLWLGMQTSLFVSNSLDRLSFSYWRTEIRMIDALLLIMEYKIGD